MTDSEWAYLLAALQWKFGILIGLAAWQTIIRIVMVFVNAKAQEFMENAIPEDKEWAIRLFNHRGYRLIKFVLNAALSVKLPTEARKRNGNGSEGEMKNGNGNGVKVVAALLLAAVMVSTVGCRTTNSQTGEQEYDPVKTEQVIAAVETPIKSVIRRIVTNSPEHATEIAGYMRYVGTVFCDMQARGEFDPSVLVAQLDSIVAPRIKDDLVIDAKNSLISLYRIFYADRFRAELPPDQWARHVADLFCRAIDGGLKDAGQPGVK